MVLQIYQIYNVQVGIYHHQSGVPSTCVSDASAKQWVPTLATR